MSTMILACCEQELTGYRPFLEPQPATPACFVVAQVDISTQYFDEIALAEPTASPVPTSVLGNITFNVSSLLPKAVEVRFLSKYACSSSSMDTFAARFFCSCKRSTLAQPGTVSCSAASEASAP